MKNYISEQPVIAFGVTSGMVIALMTAVITLLQVSGTTAMTQETIAAIIGVTSIVLTIITSAIAHTKTTPMSNPKLNDGTRLIPETDEIKAFVLNSK
jgi:uncharacterized membrane protein YdcZ (DUF606 family)